MEKKNKMLLIAAIGTMVIFTLATVVRCAVFTDNAPEIEQPAQEAPIVQESEPGQLPNENLTNTDAIKLFGINDDYTVLIDGNSKALNSELIKHISEHHPTATSATWDGEVYIDYKSGTVLSTFTLNDSTKTIISATYTKANNSFKIS